MFIEAYLDCREDDSTVGMLKSWEDTLNHTLCIFGILSIEAR